MTANFSDGIRPFNSYTVYSKKQFGQRVQKISIDAGFTCPNRDGTAGRGGCTFCDNQTFNPFYCSPKKSVSRQLHEGIAFFEPKYKTQQYLAYFQAYSNTYARLDVLKNLYRQALEVPKVIGLVIGTRPDCVNEEILDYLAELSRQYYVVIEYGLESTLDHTLQAINRGHTHAQSEWAIEQTAQRGILQAVHLILGLPGESRTDLLHHAKEVSALPVQFLKLHQLQIIKGTAMAQQYRQTPEMFELFTSESFTELVVDFMELLNPEIIVERFISESPPDMLLAPKWGGLKNYAFVHQLIKRFGQRSSYQGRLFRKE